MRVPVKQPVKLPTKLHPVWGEHIQRRDFLTLSGTTDYIKIGQLLEITGDFYLSFLIIIHELPAITKIVVGRDDTNVDFFAVTATGNLRVDIGGVQADTTSITVPTGILSKVEFSRTGSEVVVSVNGSSEVVQSVSATLRINSFMRGLPDASARYLEGVLSSVNLTNSAVSGYWPISTAGDTILDVVGGNHGTLINGSSSDWERFEKAPGWDYWLGEEILRDGEFKNGFADWGKAEADWTVDSGVATYDGYGLSEGRDLYEYGALNGGGYFMFSYNVVSYSFGAMKSWTGVTTNIDTSVGRHSVVLVESGNPNFVIYGVPDQYTQISLSNLSLKKMLKEAA